MRETHVSAIGGKGTSVKETDVLTRLVSGRLMSKNCEGNRSKGD